jgi:hypothetical protein
MIPKKASQVVYATGSPKHNVQKAFSGGKRNKKRASPNCSKKTSPKFKKKASPKGTILILLYRPKIANPGEGGDEI